MTDSWPLTKNEIKWLIDMQKMLNKCPERFGFYTIGDHDLQIYDYNKDDEINDLMDQGKAGDFCIGVAMIKADLGSLKFTKPVLSTAG